jgi:hypothetical protein
MAERDEAKDPARISPREIAPEPSEPFSLEDEIEKQPGVPKTPQGWWTLGLTVMAILIAVLLWRRYY